MEIRVARPEDAAAVRRAVAAAFGAETAEHGTQVADLWDAVEAAGHVRASLVADGDGAVVGHVGVSHAWVDARPALVDVAVLGPLSVRPEAQRGGIGTALVAAAVEAARGLGVPAIFLEGAPHYYGARGFRKASDLGFAPASARTPDAAFQVVVLDTHEEWMTGRLVYRDVWWVHDSTGLRDPRLAELEGRFGRSS
ncbi:GNAT family N-acetyltransferase [Nocardioides guangzhouensis]|uniref:GNAT family N-acetyltransferase n=1 Tax=Nocardioides guangzhouensis TaxID=2497878 RepID=A0A4Q4ZGY4_9ACTN|nr:GNAT family N-acetyltransferase [Nocardioides guangzhouensis]RYP87025.1 GNAT family N-acetyltransferase [Nocardioides guangzhouensis]